MSNPKDWFRRRRSETIETHDDPLTEDSVLDLGRAAVMLREGRALSVPPPRAAATGRVLPSNAFVLRPQLIRRDSPPPAEPAPKQPAAAAAPLRAPERREPPPFERREPFAVERRDPAPAATRRDPAPAPAPKAEERRAPGDLRLAPATDPFPPKQPSAPKPPAADPFAAKAPPPAPKAEERRAPGDLRLAPATDPFPPKQPPAPKPPAADPFAAKAPPPAAKAEDDGNSFTLDAPGPNWVRGKPRGGAEAQRMQELLRNAFTPTRPKHDAAMFSGRFREMQRIIAAIEEERAHVVVYGERGSGKTSLCNILAGKAGEAGYFVLQYACSTGVSFEEIFRTFLRRIPASFLAEGLGLGSRRVDSFAQLLPEGAFGISDLIEVFGRIHDRHVILIVDEYDRVSDEAVKARLAELIKIMSDASVPVTMLLIGVADDVRDLFGKHPSLQRALVTVPMPMMSRRDLEGLIAAGETHAGLVFVPAVREKIIDFAQGLPYQAQLLCLFAARNAVRRNAREVEREDLRYAIERAAEEAESRIKDGYGLAVGMPTESAFEDVLFHAARAHSDEFGTFTAADVSAAGPPAEGESSLLALQYPLKKLTEPERGAVLRRLVTVTGQRYQFCSQMFRNYVLVNQALRRGLI